MPPKAKGKGGHPRGVSMEEKRRRLLAIFKEPDASGRPICYNIKKLEDIGNKRGVQAMQVKDIMADLVSDKLVDCEKIGAGNFYWALPSKEGQRKRARVLDLTEMVTKEQAKLATEKMRNVSLQAGRTQGKARVKELAVLEKLKEEEAKASAELQKVRDRDPTVLRALKAQAVLDFENASRWGDNISQLREYAQGKLGMQIEHFDEQYETGEADCEAITWSSFGANL